MFVASVFAMSTVPYRRERLIDKVNEEWRNEVLPNYDISVPEEAFPSQNDTDVTSADSIQDNEYKWTDTGLGDVR